MTQSAKRRMTPPQTHKPATLALIAAFAAIYFIWGSTFLAIRFAVETLPPLLMMGTRHLVAGSLLLSFLLLVRKQAKPEPTLWLHALVAGGFCFLGCHGLLAWAEMRIDSGLAALLSATLPIFMVVLARLRGQERELTPRVLSGIAIGLIGVAILIPFKFDAADRPQWIAALSVIVCEILWACGAIYSRGVKTTTPATTFAAMQMICGGTLLWTTGLLFGDDREVAAGARLPHCLRLAHDLHLLHLAAEGKLTGGCLYPFVHQSGGRGDSRLGACRRTVQRTHPRRRRHRARQRLPAQPQEGDYRSRAGTGIRGRRLTAHNVLYKIKYIVYYLSHEAESRSSRFFRVSRRYSVGAAGAAQPDHVA
jgi:drug/metabolite transporter (DMT)-like permease